MGRIHVEETAIIDAQPEEIYELVADYRKHPSIMPPALRNLKIESGSGRGAGTIVSYDVVIGGVTYHQRAIATEPEPGSVLVETGIDDPSRITTFTVVPQGNGQRTRFTISTDMDVRDGLVGWLEKVITISVLRNTYKKELRQTALVVRQQSSLVDVK